MGKQENERRPGCVGTTLVWKSEAGGDVLSHPVARAVPSALRGLTTVFGMGTGGSPAPWPPATRLLGLGVRSSCAFSGVLEAGHATWEASVGLSRLPFGLAKPHGRLVRDRKSTRLNSSHVKISYAVFCLKKKKQEDNGTTER